MTVWILEARMNMTSPWQVLALFDSQDKAESAEEDLEHHATHLPEFEVRVTPMVVQ